MSKNPFKKIAALILILAFFAIAFTPRTSAIIPGNSTAWFWSSDTNVVSMAVGDVNGDNQIEIVTAGTYFDGLRYNAQLIVWNSSNLAAENVKSWYWINDTEISSVAIGDVDADGKQEIVTGGAYFDGTFWNAQLIVWNGSTLVAENMKGWFWANNTQIASVAIGDVNGDNQTDIVTGGTYNDGVRSNAQLIVWNGSSLAAQSIKGWFWSNNTDISSLAIGDVNADNRTDIVTGGIYNDGVRSNAQLIVWNGSSLAAQSIKSWFWTNDTQIASVAIGDVNGDNQTEIVTGGSYNDNVRNIAQVISWNGTNLAAESIAGWFTTSNTLVSSVAIGDADASPGFEVVTGGQYFDGLAFNAQMYILNGTSFVLKDSYAWTTISNTLANSVAISKLGTLTNHVVTGGQFSDNLRYAAQLRLWG